MNYDTYMYYMFSEIHYFRLIKKQIMVILNISVK